MSEVCLALEEKLIAYVDEELESPVEKALINDHVGRCDHCKSIVQDLQGVGLAVHEFFDALNRGPLTDDGDVPVGPEIPAAIPVSDPGGDVVVAVQPAQPSGLTKAWGSLQNNASSSSNSPDTPTTNSTGGRAWGGTPTTAPASPVIPEPELPPAVPDEPETVVLTPSPPMRAPSTQASIPPPPIIPPPPADLLSSSTGRDTNAPIITDLAQLVGQELGGYLVVEEIAHGGMGTVFRAIQISMDRAIALKVLALRLSEDEVFVRRFAREARAAAQLDHTNLVRIYDVGDEQGCNFYSMELIIGSDLKEILKDKTFLPIEQAMKLGIQSCLAMEMADKHGIVHRDIKPANILIEEKTGDVKIADLGLAKENRADHDGAITVDRTVMGSPNYMSPEQAEDVRKADHQSDVYALGATLYHMVTGEAPYGKGKPVEILARMLTTPLEIPNPVGGPALDANIKKIIHKAMAKGRDQRYSHAKSLRLDLENYLRAYKARPALSSESDLLNRSGVARNVRIKGRSSRRPYEGVSAKPSRALLLLSSILGFMVIGLLCQILIKAPIVEEPVAKNDQAPKAAVVKKAPNGAALATKRAKERKEEEARRVLFAALIEDLKNPKKEYVAVLSQIKKLGDQTLDVEFEDKISRVLNKEETVRQSLDAVLTQCLTLERSFSTDDAPEKLHKTGRIGRELCKKYNYHPLSQEVLNAVASLDELKKQWAEREFAAINDNLEDKEFDKVKEGVRKLQARLDGMGLLAQHQKRFKDIKELVFKGQEEARQLQILAKAREALPAIYERTYSELAMANVSAFDKRIKILDKQVKEDFKEEAEVRRLVLEHIQHVKQARSVLLACRKALYAIQARPLILGRETGRKDLKIGRWLKEQELGEDGRAISGQRDNLMYVNPIGTVQIHELGTKIIIKYSQPNSAALASFFALRGDFDLAGDAAKTVSPESTGKNKLVENFKQLLEIYQSADGIQAIAKLNKEAEGVFKRLDSSLKKGLKNLGRRREQSWLRQLLSPKFAGTKTFKDNQTKLKEWEEAMATVSAKPSKSGSYTYWKLDSRKLDGKKAIERKVLRHFQAPVTSPMEDHYTVHYDFTNSRQRKNWKTERYLFDQVDERSFKLDVPAAFNEKKPWGIFKGRLWGKGMDRLRLRAPIVAGYMRVEMEVVPFSGGNIVVDLGYHGGQREAGYLQVSPLMATPEAQERLKKSGYMEQWNKANKPQARVLFKEEGPGKGWEYLYQTDKAPQRLELKPHRFCIEVMPFEQYVKMVGEDKITDMVKDRAFVLIGLLKRHEGPWEVVIPALGLRDFPEGNFAIETYGSCITYNKIEVTARFEREWLEEE
jgi:serine/threonine protein kinase